MQRQRPYTLLAYLNGQIHILGHLESEWTMTRNVLNAPSFKIRVLPIIQCLDEKVLEVIE